MGFDNLPNPIILQIFKNLPLNDLLTLVKVSRRLKSQSVNALNDKISILNSKVSKPSENLEFSVHFINPLNGDFKKEPIYRTKQFNISDAGLKWLCQIEFDEFVCQKAKLQQIEIDEVRYKYLQGHVIHSTAH